MRNEIILNGCAPEPLIHYLKALGIFRLIADQLDSQVRGAWRSDAFVLDSEKNGDDLVAFFLNEYQPTPIVAPWNGGSAFYDGEDITAREAIRKSSGERLEAYREVVEKVLAFPEMPSTSRLTVADLISSVERIVAGATDKGTEKQREVVEEAKRLMSAIARTHKIESKTIEQIQELRESLTRSDEARLPLNQVLKLVRKLRTLVKKSGRSSVKEEIVRACRNRLDDRTVQWIDAALVISDTDSEAPLLGAGGIDGRAEFSKNFMLSLQQTLPELVSARLVGREAEKQLQHSTNQLRSSLFGQASALTESTVGMFFPKGVGGAANASQGPRIDSDESMVNSWDYLLAIEGTLMLASATVRQLAAGARSKASFPFTAINSAVGYGTAVAAEKVRAEIWLPLWSRPASFAEVAHIFSEGRVQFTASEKRTVRTGFDFARAVAELGVDRGIDAFQRYGFIERNGQANLATPLGRFEVRERPLASLVYQVDNWFDAFRRATGDSKRTPPRFVRARARIEKAIFDLCASGQREDLLSTLVALGAAESELARGAKFREKERLRPLPGLRERWANECDDGSIEFEIAAALASIAGEGKRGTFRAHLEPVEISGSKLVWTNDESGVVWGAGMLSDNLAAVLHRRSIDARADGASHPALSGKRPASLAAVDAFLRGLTDDARSEELLRGLSLINWHAERQAKHSSAALSTLPRIYALLKLLFLPNGLLKLKEQNEPITIRHEPSIVPLLRGGRVDEALEIASRRLHSSGLVPMTSRFHFPPEDGTRLAASLLIPIDASAIKQLADLVLRPSENDNSY